jgi:hypothetical protein
VDQLVFGTVGDAMRVAEAGCRVDIEFGVCVQPVPDQRTLTLCTSLSPGWLR